MVAIVYADPCNGGSLLTAGDDRRSMNTIGKAHKLTALSRNRSE